LVLVKVTALEKALVLVLGKAMVSEKVTPP
jgi:hypothetical protein